MQRRQSLSDLHFHIFDLEDFKNKFILILSGTLVQILGAIYEKVSVPYLS